MVTDDDADTESVPEATKPSSGLIATEIDLLGLGALAKSPAAKEIGRAIGRIVGAFTDPARTLLMGLAKNKVEANKITSIARAEAKAREIEVKSEDLIERMKARVITTELRRQLNIEAATTEAISYVDQHHPDDASRSIDDDWMANWMEGAQQASDREVRGLWAKLLASQSLSRKQSVSGPTLTLMRNLDADLAGAFEDYVAFLAIYRCYPFHSSIQPNAVPERKLNILQEIGFLSRQSPRSFAFADFEMAFGSNIGLRLLHDSLGLTHRSHELVLSLFNPPPFDTTWKSKAQNTEQKVITYAGLIEAAITVGPRPITLTFGSQGQTLGFTAILNIDPQPASMYCEDGPAITRELGKHGLTPSELQQGLFEAVQQRGIKIALRSA
jgi:hypothetical protein